MKKYPLTIDTEKLARLLALAGEPTRLRILYLLYEQEEACVTQISESLGMTIANISQHLQLLRDNGLCTAERRGNTICYRLIHNTFTQQLKHVLV